MVQKYFILNKFKNFGGDNIGRYFGANDVITMAHGNGGQQVMACGKNFVQHLIILLKYTMVLN